MKGSIWVITANSSVARIFEAENNQHLKEISTLIHPKSRMKGTDLETDRPGRTTDRVGPGRHMVQETIELKEHEATVFAKEVATVLDKAVAEGKVKKIYIVAAPTFLGILRKHFHTTVEKVIAGEVDKDVSSLSLEKIREHLPLVL